MSTLGASRSEGNLSINPRLSEQRREKLLNLKKREDLKDALIDKFKGRFGHGAEGREDDEMSVASGVIKKEVNDFAQTAKVTATNLERLERRLQSKARKKAADEMSVASVSAYSVGSRASFASQRSRSVASAAGMAVMRERNKFDWSRLDEYASYLHEQDALRHKLGVQALQRKLRMDLDAQIADKRKKRDDAAEEERRYHRNSMVELERWKLTEQQREEEKHMKLMKEKQDRDEQLQFERKLKAEETDKKKVEEATLVEQIINEMELEQRKFEKKKEQTKKSMRKVFEENREDQLKRDEQLQEQKQQEAAAMLEYNRVLDEQEEQRAEELAARLEKQSQLMKKLQANVASVQKNAGDNDAQRAQAQQDEMDRHFFEAEALKQNRLKELRLENQAYLLKQMEEKDSRKGDERELQDIQASILMQDTREYNEIEKQKLVDKRIRLVEHQGEIRKQMQHKHQMSAPDMSEHEMAMNKPLLELVDKTLQAKEETMPRTFQSIEEEEDIL